MAGDSGNGNEAKKGDAVSRRDTLRLATAVSALGVGLGAALVSKDADADAAPSIHQLKLDGLKLDSLVLSIHKGDASSPPVHAVDVTPIVTQNLKFLPGTYYLKLTGLKYGTPVMVAIDQFSFK